MEGKLDFDVKRLMEGVASKNEDQWMKQVKFYEEMKEFEDNFDIRFDELCSQLASMFKESQKAIFQEESGKETSFVQQSDQKTADFELSHQLTNSNRGYKRFFRRDMLETSDYLKDDCLRISCTVGVVVSGIDSSISPSLTVPASDIGAHSGMLL